MITLDLSGRTVVVTGGTRGLGKAIGIEFSRAGFAVFLTHRWGSVEERTLVEEFRSLKLPPPRIVESDVSDRAATRSLMGLVRDTAGPLDVVVSNVAFAKIVRGLGDLTRSSFDLSVGYSAWPVVDLVQAAEEVMGRLPRYVIGISSDGGEVCHDGYDLAGASKAVLETLCRYLAHRLRPRGVRVNVVRPGFFDSASSRATLGDAVVEELRRRQGERRLEPATVARVCLALCSGLMDGVSGQTIVVDEGWSLVSPLALLTGGRGGFGGGPEQGP
jgi:NAD(P)-dependent dehydrogenase (short-subunit alcohol dehydrogenase family)